MSLGASESLGQPIVCPILVGRAPLVERLRWLIEAAEAGEGGAALLSGEAGIGKSRLVAEARQCASARGFEVIQSACYPQDRGCAYGPLLDLLRTRFSRSAEATRATVARPFARELAPLLPDLVSPPAEAGPAPLDAELERRRLYEAILRCLTVGADERPILVIVEDLHWCDAASLDVLLHLARRAAGQRVLLLGSYRAEDSGTEPRRWLAQLERERLAQDLTLPTLSRREVAGMLAVIFHDAEPVPEGLVDQLHGLADGNPFHVEELLKAVVAAGRLRREGERWRWDSGDGALQLPRSLNEAVQQRVALLGQSAREVLTLAAVIGRDFDFDLLQVLAGLDERTLLGRIKELIAAQLVVEASPDRFSFRHALTRRAIYSELLARERVALHRAVAEAAERVYGSALEQRLDDLAYHFSEGQAWERALEYARQAGERAQRLYAPRVALEQYSRALAAARRLREAPAGGSAVSPTALAELHRARGRAYETLGEFSRALEDYERAVELARSAGNRQTEWRGLSNLGLLWAGRDYEQAGRCFQQALELARTLDDPSRIAHSLNRVGNWMVNTAQPRQAPPLHREALAIFEQLDDRPGVAATLDLLGTASYLAADLPGAIVYYERAASLFEQLDDRPGLVGVLTMLATRGGSYELGSMTADAANLEAGLQAGERSIELARAIDWRASEAFGLATIATVLGLRGDYDRALSCACQALEIADEIEHRQWVASAHNALGLVYWDLLAAPTARRHFERSLELARELRSTFWIQMATGCLACVYVLEQELGRAAELLGPVPPVDQPVESLGERWLSYAHAHLALARNDPSLALRLLDRVNAQPLDGGTRGDTPRPAMVRGEVLTALGRPDEAEALLRRVHSVVVAQGARPQVWRSHTALGNLYRAQGRTVEAQREYSQARSVIEELAAGLTDPGLRDEFLRNATARLPRPYRLSPRRVETARFGGLTAREREVALLVAQGRSNREIAEALVLGERTIETHVSNLLGKLGLASRREVAAWIAERGRLQSDS